MNFSDIKKIIIHCSNSEFGDVNEIDRWHRERGFSKIGYHFVITNGRLTPGGPYQAQDDGLIQFGRPITEQGAHCRGHNKDSIGVCLIGNHHFTGAQILHALPDILAGFMALPNITGPAAIFGHSDFNRKKPCPNIDTALLRFLAVRARDKNRPTSSPSRRRHATDGRD